MPKNVRVGRSDFYFSKRVFVGTIEGKIRFSKKEYSQIVKWSHGKNTVFSGCLKKQKQKRKKSRVGAIVQGRSSYTKQTLFGEQYDENDRW